MEVGREPAEGGCQGKEGAEGRRVPREGGWEDLLQPVAFSKTIAHWVAFSSYRISR